MRRMRQTNNVFVIPKDENATMIVIDKQHGKLARLVLGLSTHKDLGWDRDLVIFVKGSGMMFEVDRLYRNFECTPQFWWGRFRDGDLQARQDVEARLRSFGADTHKINLKDEEDYWADKTIDPPVCLGKQQIDVVEVLKERLLLGIKIRRGVAPVLMVFMKEHDSSVSELVSVHYAGHFEGEPLEWYAFSFLDFLSCEEAVHRLGTLGFAPGAAKAAVKQLCSIGSLSAEDC